MKLRRLFAVITAITMVSSMAPAMVFAEDATQEVEENVQAEEEGVEG